MLDQASTDATYLEVNSQNVIFLFESYLLSILLTYFLISAFHQKE